MSRKTHWTVPELPWKKENKMNNTGQCTFRVPNQNILKTPQYPLPWSVRFDWQYGNDSSEVLWTCQIGYFGEIPQVMGRGYATNQFDALVKAIENMRKKDEG